MGLQLSSVGYGKIVGGALFFVGLGAYQAYEGVNHALNYAQITATVTEVTSLCAFDTDSPLYTGVMRWTSLKLPTWVVAEIRTLGLRQWLDVQHKRSEEAAGAVLKSSERRRLKNV